MNEYPKMRMFAGPNGAGKSTLITEIQANNYANLGVLLNADDVYKLFAQQPHLDLSNYKLARLTQGDLESFAASFQNIEERLKKSFQTFSLFINEGFLVKINRETNISSYEAAFVIDFFREMLLRERKHFSFETVMSHASKLRFITKAKKAGFKTYLYFVAADSPEIHVQRVRNRVKKGGHDVPEDKIIERYNRALDNLFDALQLINRAFLIDTSGQENQLIAEKFDNGKLEVYKDSVPWWLNRYVIEKFPG